MKYFFVLLPFLLLNLSSFGNEALSDDQINQIVEKYFLKDNLPVRYVAPILVRIDKNASKSDSIIIQDLINKLDKEISIYEVCLVNTVTANLEIRISHQEKFNDLLPKIEVRKKNYQIIKNTVYVNIPPETNDLETKKIIHYYVLRSLIWYIHHTELLQDIPGSVFAEYSPNNITFSEVDYQILRKVYSKAYDKELRSKKTSSQKIESTKLKYAKQLYISSRIIGIVVCVLIMFFLLQKGFFKNHNYQLYSFAKQGLIVFLIVILYLVFYSSVLFYQYVIIFKQNTKFIPPVHHLIISIILIGVASIILAYYAEKKILQNKRNHFIQVFSPVLSTFIFPTALILLVNIFYSSYYHPDYKIDSDSLFMPAISILGLLTALRSLYIFLNIRSENLIHQKDVELAKLGELHKQAELQSLRSKINPHFLYNSLNSIASLALSDPQKTEEMALSLSDFFKYSINREQKQTNPIAEELELVKTYLEIEKVRFGERLNFEIDCPKNLMEIKIPQLLIQPLVENAVKHGIAQILADGKIKISVLTEKGCLKIRVSDNGPAFPSGPLSGFGIRNTHERLALMYGKKASLNWDNGDDKFIEITLPTQQK